MCSPPRVACGKAAGSKVGLAAPAEVGTPYGKAVLVAWAVNGSAVIPVETGIQYGVDRGDQPTYGLTVDSDANITAEYELPQGLEEYPPPGEYPPPSTFLPLLVSGPK